jgi:carbonic anhydrase
MSSRLVAAALAAVSLLATASALGDDAHHEAPSKPPVAAAPATGPTPDEALATLRAGNERFKSGKSTHPHVGAKRLVETAAGQHPIATILSCSDSRVPPEVLFDEGIGDVFAIRVVGNVVDTAEMASVEYGVDHLGTALLVVMGETKCGAVTAVATRATVHGHIPALLEHINEAVEATRKRYPSATDTDLVPEATRANVFQSIATLLKESDSVRERVESGKAQLVGALYDVETGNVEWLGRHQEEAALIAEAKKTTAAHGSGHGAKPAAKGGHDKHASTSGHGSGSTAVVANVAAHAPHGAAAAGGAPAAPPAPSIPSPYTFVLVALLCTLGGSISGRLTAKAG